MKGVFATKAESWWDRWYSVRSWQPAFLMRYLQKAVQKHVNASLQQKRNFVKCRRLFGRYGATPESETPSS